MSNSKLKEVFSYKSWVHAVAGATGSVIAMSTFYPLDTVRSRLQLEEPERRKALGTMAMIQQLIMEEGLPTLYRGMIPVLQSLCISNFVYFYTFHSLKAFRGGQKSQSALIDLLLGALAGVVNVLGTTPFWVVNTRLKMKGINRDNTLQYSNLIDGLVYIQKTEGFAGLWSGTIPSLMLVINPALQFMTYEMIKRRVNKVYGEVPGIVYFSVGAVAKIVSTLITYPLQVVQTKLRHSGGRISGQKSDKNIGTIQMLMYLLKQNGVIGLYRGLEAKLLQTVLTAALMFAIYEKIAKFVMSLLMRHRKIVPAI